MLITAYGMFWSKDEVTWAPGQGHTKHNSDRPFELLGRRGKQRGTLEMLDARLMHGVYILHSAYGAYYVGLANGNYGFGSRLKSHTIHKPKEWTSFSWFAFDQLLQGYDDRGYRDFKVMPEKRLLKPEELIHDVEALLMLSLGTIERGNKHTMKFQQAKRWTQVPLHERGEYLDRIR